MERIISRVNYKTVCLEMPPKRKKHVNKAFKGSKEVLFREDPNHSYAIVLRPLGDRRFLLLCDDGKERIGKLRGNIRRSEFVQTGTIVLVSERLESEKKVDIFHKYPDVHVKMLTRYKELDELNGHYLKWQRDNELGPRPSRHTQDDEEEELVVFEVDDDLIIDDV